MFEIGKIYNRKNDIHAKFKGQQYGGIATPADYPYIFIFTGDTGAEYGYHDGYGADDTYWYTGEGQSGDMQLTRGNRAIIDHRSNGKNILLFESTNKGHVRFSGYCTYVTHHTEQRIDVDGNYRQVIIFHLDIASNYSLNKIENNSAPYLETPKRTSSLAYLREQIQSSAPIRADLKMQLQVIRNRSEATKVYAKKRADGFCEACKIEAPFNTPKGPYLEVHHLTRLSDGGPDLPENVVALCPTCHRRAHHAVDSENFNAELVAMVKQIEASIA